MVSSSSNPIDIHIGQRIQLARILAGLTREDLAGALGISTGQLRSHEQDGQRLTAGALFAIAKLLNQPVGFFYEGLTER